MEPQKRKIQEEETEKENKKPHNESEFSSTQISAESTHIEDADESKSVESILKERNITEESDDETLDNSHVEAIMTVLNSNQETNQTIASLNEIISQLQSDLDIKDKEIQELKAEKESMKCKFATQETKMKRYKKAIIKLNGIAGIVPPKEAPKVPRKIPGTLSQRKRKCRYENRGKCRNYKDCPFFKPERNMPTP